MTSSSPVCELVNVFSSVVMNEGFPFPRLSLQDNYEESVLAVVGLPGSTPRGVFTCKAPPVRRFKTNPTLGSLLLCFLSAQYFYIRTENVKSILAIYIRWPICVASYDVIRTNNVVGRLEVGASFILGLYEYKIPVRSQIPIGE